MLSDLIIFPQAHTGRIRGFSTDFLTSSYDSLEPLYTLRSGCGNVRQKDGRLFFGQGKKGVCETIPFPLWLFEGHWFTLRWWGVKCYFSTTCVRFSCSVFAGMCCAFLLNLESFLCILPARCGLLYSIMTWKKIKKEVADSYTFEHRDQNESR